MGLQIAYTAGYLVSWIVMCILAVLWVPLFSVSGPSDPTLLHGLGKNTNTSTIQWWVPNSTEPETPSDPTDPTSPASTHTKLNDFLYKFDLTVLSLNILINLGTYIYHLINTFIYVGPRPHPSNSSTSVPSPSPSLNTRKAWGIRALLFSGVCTSLALGHCIFTVLEATDLARVKTLEYWIVVVPIQVNIGVLLGSAVQFRAEKRAVRKMGLKRGDAEAVVVVEEKERLIEV